MKSILANFKQSKTVVLTIFEALNFDFLGTFDIFKCEIPKISKFKLSKIGKTTVFDPLKSAKIDFT